MPIDTPRVEPILLPDVQMYDGWKKWGARLVLDVHSFFQSLRSNIPRKGWAQVRRTTNFAPGGANTAIPWEALLNDVTPGAWVVGQPTRLTVQARPGGVDYFIARVVSCITFTDPGASANALEMWIRRNGALAAGDARKTAALRVGVSESIEIVSPWYTVKPGDYFETVVTLTGTGTAQVAGGDHTWSNVELWAP